MRMEIASPDVALSIAPMASSRGGDFGDDAAQPGDSPMRIRPPVPHQVEWPGGQFERRIIHRYANSGISEPSCDPGGQRRDEVGSGDYEGCGQKLRQAQHDAPFEAEIGKP